jgi:hypothetical protein
LQYLPNTTSSTHQLVSANIKGELHTSTIENDVEGFKLQTQKLASTAKAPVTALDFQSEIGHMIVVSEDGSYSIWDSLSNRIVVDAVKASESCLNSAKWISPHSFVIASHSTEIQVWDTRVSNSVPTRILKENAETSSNIDRRVWSIDNNPARPWLIGSSVSGPSNDVRPTVMFHDLRAAPQPVLINSSLHIGHIWQLNFHPDHPDLVLTASDDGTLLEWNTASAFNATSTLKPASISSNLQKKQNVRRLRNDGLPINHFKIDTHHNLVISTSDAESITFNVDLI